MIKFFTKRMNNKKGFTLIELIVVIAILGILVAIVVPRIGRFRTKAANTAHNANVRTLLGAASICLAEEGAETTFIWGGENDDASWEDYINSWPTPPKGADYDDAEPKFEGTGDIVYTVTMGTGDQAGEIIVTPGFIPEEGESSGEGGGD